MPCSLCLVISLFEVASKHRAEELSRVPKHKKAVTCLLRTHVIEKLPSGKSSGAIGCEFNVNESTVCIK